MVKKRICMVVCLLMITGPGFCGELERIAASVEKLGIQRRGYTLCGVLTSEQRANARKHMEKAKSEKVYRFRDKTLNIVADQSTHRVLVIFEQFNPIDQNRGATPAGKFVYSLWRAHRIRSGPYGLLGLGRNGENYSRPVQGRQGKGTDTRRHGHGEAQLRDPHHGILRKHNPGEKRTILSAPIPCFGFIRTSDLHAVSFISPSSGREVRHGVESMPGCCPVFVRRSLVGHIQFRGNNTLIRAAHLQDGESGSPFYKRVSGPAPMRIWSSTAYCGIVREMPAGLNRIWPGKYLGSRLSENARSGPFV